MGPLLDGKRPYLESAAAVPAFLGGFFQSGRIEPSSRVEITDGLWSLLEWCWSLPASKRNESRLCRVLIARGGSGWYDEADVLDAMARRMTEFDPSRLSPTQVQPFLEAFVADAERSRGRSRDLTLRLEFFLPPIGAHPVFSPDLILSALQQAGTRTAAVDEHLEAVHPERRPYRGSWRIRVADRADEVADGADLSSTSPPPCSGPHIVLRLQGAERPDSTNRRYTRSRPHPGGQRTSRRESGADHSAARGRADGQSRVVRHIRA